jgi:hypothetical protein
MKSSTALRTAGPAQNMPAPAVHGAAVSDPKPKSLSAPLSNQGEERAEKLVLQQCQGATSGEAKSVDSLTSSASSPGPFWPAS